MSKAAPPVTQAWFERQMRWAGILTLGGLALAVLYELHSTPYTMSGFLMGSPLLVCAAIGLYLRARLRQNRAQQARLTPAAWEAGQTIFRQGDPADCIYLITHGEVETFLEHPDHGRLLLRRLGVHEYFGEGAAFNQGTRPATAVAASPVKLLRIDQADFLMLYTHLPELREHLQTQIEHRQPLPRLAPSPPHPRS